MTVVALVCSQHPDCWLCWLLVGLAVVLSLARLMSVAPGSKCFGGSCISHRP